MSDLSEASSVASLNAAGKFAFNQFFVRKKFSQKIQIFISCNLNRGTMEKYPEIWLAALCKKVFPPFESSTA
jgi:hypothetical protein